LGLWGGLVWGCLANRSQIGLTLFAETLEFVEGAVEGALQTAFLAVEQAQGGFAPSGGVAHAAGVIQIEILLDGCEDFQFGDVEAGFLMVEASKPPIRQG
jgi:hypothetical protein